MENRSKENAQTKAQREEAIENMGRRYITHVVGSVHLGEKTDNGAELLFYIKPKPMKHVNAKIQKVV